MHRRCPNPNFGKAFLMVWGANCMRHVCLMSPQPCEPIFVCISDIIGDYLKIPCSALKRQHFTSKSLGFGVSCPNTKLRLKTWGWSSTECQLGSSWDCAWSEVLLFFFICSLVQIYTPGSSENSGLSFIADSAGTLQRGFAWPKSMSIYW